MSRGGARSNSGPKVKPTALKLLTGNPGRRPLPQGEPMPARPASLEPPWSLVSAARAFWDRYAPMLLDLGLLTEADMPEFATACEQDALYRRLMDRTLAHPFGKTAQAVSVRMNKALEQRDRILGRFGFDPSSRAKLSVEAPKADDEFDRLFRS